jgi:hypothetical protein
VKRKIIHIVLALFLGLSVNAQILAPMGYGLPAAPQKITSYNNGLIVAYENQSKDIELQVWNGDFWYKIEKPNLPKLGTNTDGLYTIVDLAEYNGEIYLCAAYTSKLNASATNSILKWDGSSWEDKSTTVIENSKSLDKLVVQNGVIQCVGKFTDQNGDYNIVKQNNGVFKVAGNLITRNFNSDDFNSIAVANDKIYATGSFTDPASGNNSLVVWDGNQWEAAEFPPFLGENITTGQFNNEVVVYGKSNFSTETVKISSGKLWQDMSAGLESFTVSNINHFAEVGGSLFAVGNFEENSTQTTYNILEFDGQSWSKTNLYLSDIEQLFSAKESVIVSGDFSDNARIKFIGEIFKNKAQIATRVYHDKNNNCIKDANEDWFSNYPVSLDNSVKYLSTDHFGQLYLPISKESHKINAATVDYWQPTCPDVNLNVSEYKTYYGSMLGVNQQVGIRDATVHISDNKSYVTTQNERKRALVCYESKGSQPINDAILTLNHGASITNFTSEENYDSYSNNTAVWTINLNANEQQCFYISYDLVDALDATLDLNVKLQDGQTDQDASNNSGSLSYEEGETLINDKHCGNGKYIAKNETLLQYKIGFKNVNSTTALDLKISDELDTDIYISYKGIQSYTSHDCDVRVDYELMDNGNYKNKLVYSFNNINLPSAESNNALSEGFIDMNINILPNMIAKGETLCNTAKLYYSYKKGTFDEPIFTQTVCSEVNETGAIIGNNAPPSYIDGLEIGPNPVKDILYFNNLTKKDFDVVLTNAIGQQINSFKISSESENAVNLSEFKAGIYFIYAEGIFVHKFIIH